MKPSSRVLASLLCAVVLVSCGRTPPETQGTLGVTRIEVADRGSALSIAGAGLDGAPLSLDDLRGKVTVLNSWASWCAPCIDEAPLLADAARQFGSRAAFLGLNVNDESAAADAFIQKYGIAYPSIVDGDGRLLASIPGVPPKALPNTVILDRQGRIAATIVGPVRGSELAEVIDEVSAER